MKNDRASLTAQLVAAFRGLAPDPSRRSHRLDPWAEHLLPWPLAAVVRHLGGALRLPLLHQAYNLALLSLPDHVELRTRALDAHVLAELGRIGPRAQLVVLGAGLDARAWRLDALAGLPVFEVDHPATQALKTAALTRAGAPLRARFVGVDFTRDDLGRALAEAGHDATRPTVWLWEGVTPYLPPAATRATLMAVATRSAPASAMLVTWCRPGMTGITPLATRWAAWRGQLPDDPESVGATSRGVGRANRRRGRAIFHGIGEPLLGLMTDEAFADLLASTGWTPRHHTGMRTWAADAGWLPPAMVIEERIMVADRATMP